jgi:hypothetical protein
MPTLSLLAVSAHGGDVCGITNSYWQQAGKVVTVAWLRHAVKDYFRARVEARLNDLTLDAGASYLQARRMVAGLGPADQGILMEVWYRARHATGAQAHQMHRVTRTSGDNKGLVETRVADLVVGREAREVKDIKGKIDEDQFAAYVDVLQRPDSEGHREFDKLRYVFTNPEGAIANLEFFVLQFQKGKVDGKLAIEIFDSQGNSKTVRDADSLRAHVALLRAP